MKTTERNDSFINIWYKAYLLVFIWILFSSLIYLFVYCNNHEIRLFHERGVKDIYRLLKEEPDFLNGSFIADKVIGKAAAALMILGGVKEVFAGVISRPALSLFQSHGIEPEYKIETEYIINRTRTGWCPLESRCKNLETPEDFLAEIDDFMNTMKNI